VTSFARAALGWRRTDAELAELLADSALDPESLAGTRSAAERARSVTFRASDLELDVEVRSTEGGAVILGQLAPPVRAAVEVQRDDGSQAAAGGSDELGRFRVEVSPGGRVRLRVLREPPAGPVETSWFEV